MDGGPPAFPRDFTCPAVLWIRLAIVGFRIRDSHPLWSAFPHRSPNLSSHIAVQTPNRPKVIRFGLLRVRSPLLAESHFDVFSSSYLDVSVQTVPHVMLFYSHNVDRVWLCRVSPFGNLRIIVYVPLPAAYRSLSRPSSAPDAKAFPLRSL